MIRHACCFLICFFAPSISMAQDYEVCVQNGIGFAKYDYHEGLQESCVPIIYFHGTSSSKLEPLVVLEQIKKKKRTVIAFDRPGYGDSKFVKFDSLDEYICWSETHLLPGIESVLGYRPAQFDIVSVSGGALFSLKLAQQNPDRIRHISLLSSGLLARPVGGEGKYERARRFAARRPRLANMIVRLGKRNPDLTNRVTAQKFSCPDKKFFEANACLAKKLYLDTTKHGACGIVQDARLQLCDTSYAQALPDSIQIEFWNGLCDNTLSQQTAMLLANRLGVEVKFIANEGHISSLPIGFENAVLSAE